MPPRFVYWTILIDGTPTAFRAYKREELLPTLHQLQRTQPGASLKYFSRGRLWDSEAEARAALRSEQRPERRDRDWRPGGAHEDPRDRFKKKREGRRDGRPREERAPRQDWRDRREGGGAPGKGSAHGRPYGDRPDWRNREQGPRPDRGRPDSGKPRGGPGGPKGEFRDRPPKDQRHGPRPDAGRPDSWKPRGGPGGPKGEFRDRPPKDRRHGPRPDAGRPDSWKPGGRPDDARARNQRGHGHTGKGRPPGRSSDRERPWQKPKGPPRGRPPGRGRGPKR